MERLRIHANNLQFEVLVTGQSERLVLMLHGFPDDARSFVPMMQRLTAAGYCCAAPFMRGYRPTAVPPAIDASSWRTIQITDLVGDTAALAEQLKKQLDIEQLHLVGHDWGAIAAYATVQQYPTLFAKAVMMSVPPGRVFLRNLLKNPSQFRRSAYIFYFQLPWLPEKMIRRSQGKTIEALWRAWSGDVDAYQDRINEVVDLLSAPENLRAALAYYRGLLRPLPWQWQQWNQARRLLLAPAAIPSLVLAGEHDHCIPPTMFTGTEAWLADRGGSFRTIADAGHFLPLEATTAVTEAILNHFAKDSQPATAASSSRARVSKAS